MLNKREKHKHVCHFLHCDYIANRHVYAMFRVIVFKQIFIVKNFWHSKFLSIIEMKSFIMFSTSKKHYVKFTKDAMIYLVEIRICQLKIETHRNFLRFSKKEINNCELFMKSKLSEMFVTNRLFNLQKNSVNKKNNVVILKIKNLSSKIDKKINVYWSCNIIIDQIKIVQIFILISIAKSNYIVFIFVFYFHDKKSMIYLNTIENFDATFWSIRTIWTMHSLFAFFLKLFFCMLSLKKIKIVLSNFYVFVFENIDC